MPKAEWRTKWFSEYRMDGGIKWAQVRLPEHLAYRPGRLFFTGNVMAVSGRVIPPGQVNDRGGSHWLAHPADIRAAEAIAAWLHEQDIINLDNWYHASGPGRSFVQPAYVQVHGTRCLIQVTFGWDI